MQSIWTATIVLAIIGVLVFVIGSMLPRNHSLERGLSIPVAPEIVFARLADFSGRPKWITGLQRVTIEADGRFYTEFHSSGPLRVEIVEAISPSRLVTRIADDKLEFGGTWTINVLPTSNGCTVSVREDGFVKSPLFRFVSRFIMGHTHTMDRFLKDLAAQYPQPVS